MKNTLTLFFCILFTLLAKSQSNYVQRVYDIENDNAGYNLEIGTDSNSLYLSGAFFDTASSNVKPYLIKTNLVGDIIWGKWFDNGNKDYLANFFLEKSYDGNYLVSGTIPSSNDSIEWFLAKITPNGDTLWSNSFLFDTTLSSSVSRIDLDDLYETSDHNILMLGSSNKDGFIIKSDSIGNLVWVKKYGSSNQYETETFVSISSGPNNTYTIMGYISYTLSLNDPQTMVVNINDDGTVNWAKKYYNTWTTSGTILFTKTGKHLICGTGSLPSSFQQDMYVMLIDSTGNEIWSKAFDGLDLDFGEAIIEIDTGQYLLSCSSTATDTSFSNGYDQLIVRMNESGDSLWTKRYDYDGRNDVIYASKMLNDKFYFFGSSIYFGSGSYLNITDTNGYSGCNIVPSNVNVNNTIFTTTNVSLPVTNISVASHRGCEVYSYNPTSSIVCAACAPMQEICIITVDSTSTKNLISWEKPVTNDVLGYNIYREIAGNYTKVGYVPYDSLSIYIDTASGISPQTTSYRYKISVLDSCGFEGNLSDFHETIHLTTSNGIGSEINLVWDAYEGISVSYYRILRDTSNNNLFEVIDSVPSSNFTYTDYTAIVGVPNRYLIEVIPPSPCTSTKAANYSQSRSNRPSISPTVIPIIADLNSNTTTVFVNQQVAFQDLSSGYPTNWSWYFGGAIIDTSSLQNPYGVMYQNPGNYDVTLIASNVNFIDSITKQDYINVISNNGLPPTTDFSCSETTLNTGDTASFIDLSYNAPYNWTWVFSGAENTSSSDQNPSNIVYNTPGTFDVTLITTNINGSSSITKTNYITVLSQGTYIKNINTNNDFIVSPNPTNGIVTISSSSQDELNIKIFNSAGQEIFNAKEIENNFTYKFIEQGIYTILIYNDNNIKTQKIIVTSK